MPATVWHILNIYLDAIYRKRKLCNSTESCYIKENSWNHIKWNYFWTVLSHLESKCGELSVCCSCGQRAPRKKAGTSSEEFVRFRRRNPHWAKKVDIFQKRNPRNIFENIMISHISFTIFFVFLIVVRKLTADKNMKLKNSVFYEITAGNKIL